MKYSLVEHIIDNAMIFGIMPTQKELSLLAESELFVIYRFACDEDEIVDEATRENILKLIRGK